MHLKTINLIIYIKGSKFDLINSYDVSKYYTVEKRFRIWKRTNLFLEQFDVIVKTSLHRHF